VIGVNFCCYILIFDKNLGNPFFYGIFFKIKIKKYHPHLNPPPSRGRRCVGLVLLLQERRDRFPLPRE